MNPKWLTIQKFLIMSKMIKPTGQYFSLKGWKTGDLLNVLRVSGTIFALTKTK